MELSTSPGIRCYDRPVRRCLSLVPWRTIITPRPLRHAGPVANKETPWPTGMEHARRTTRVARVAQG
eukprot:13530283-Heterocapsa_arctica.AAC.1